jgi:hypothetical protein
MYVFQSGISINGPLESAGDQGSAGEVLTSGGAGNPPTWGAGGSGGTGQLDVYLAGGAISTLTAGSPIIFDTVVLDSISGYNASTGVYTIATTGTYSLTTSVVEVNGSAGIFPHQTQILVNSNPVTSQSSAFTPGTYSNSCSIIVYLTAGDLVTVALNENIGSGIGTGVVIANAYSTRFGISAI